MDKLRELQKQVVLQLEVVTMFAAGAPPPEISAKLNEIAAQSVIIGETPFVTNGNPMIGHCIVALLRAGRLLTEETRTIIDIKPV